MSVAGKAEMGTRRARAEPDPSEPPASVRLVVVAHLGLLSALRSAVCELIEQIECDRACTSDLQLATDELAAVVIADALPWTELEVVVGHDEEDIYIRMSASRDDPAGLLEVGQLSQMLLAATAESFDVRVDGERTFAAIQRPRGERRQGPF